MRIHVDERRVPVCTGVHQVHRQQQIALRQHFFRRPIGRHRVFLRERDDASDISAAAVRS